jgi:septal ring factor EnvC (AmiA/AmiB activator)
MAASIDNDLKELLQKFDQRFDKLENKFEQRFDKLENTFEQKLEKLDNKLDKVSEDITFVKVDLATVKTKLEAIDERVNKIEGSQKNQIWSLITIIATAILGILVAGGRILFFTPKA